MRQQDGAKGLLTQALGEVKFQLPMNLRCWAEQVASLPEPRVPCPTNRTTASSWPKDYLDTHFGTMHESEMS